MQVLSVEPWNEDHNVFACRIILEPWEYTQGLSKTVDVEVVSRNRDTMRVTMKLTLRAQDELDAYKRLPELVRRE